MKGWPLRWKIAFYAAALGIIATISGAATTWLLMRAAELRAFDRRLTTEANGILRDFAPQANPGEMARAARHLAPFLARDRLVDLRRANGEILYQSPRASDLWRASMEFTKGFRTQHSAGRVFRVGQFRSEGVQLRFAGDLADINTIGRDIVFGMFGAIPTVLIVVFLGGQWVARQALGPVEEIRAAASKISVRHLEQRLPVPPAADEIAGLVGVLNQTFDRLQASFEQSTRFSADASHHLKTPIAVLRAGIEEILIDTETPPMQQTRADALLEQVRHLTSIAENLLLLARADAGSLELAPSPLGLAETLAGILDDLRTLASAARLSVGIAVERGLVVYADRSAVALVLRNLIDNAVKYNRTGGRIVVKVDRNGQTASIAIGNNGQSIPPEKVSQIFDRFARARPGQEVPGHGLGLSIARELARAQGGDLLLRDRRDDWTEFSLVLPLLASCEGKANR